MSDDGAQGLPRLVGRVHALRFRRNDGTDLTIDLQRNPLRVPLRVSVPVPEVPQINGGDDNNSRRKRAVSDDEVDGDIVMVVRLTIILAKFKVMELLLRGFRVSVLFIFTANVQCKHISIERHQ